MGLGPMIQNNYEVFTVSDIMDVLKVSRDRIVITWPKLGLKLNQKKLTQNKAYYVVVWEDLMDFLEANQKEWDSRNVEPYMLASEPDWLIEKRKRDRVENPMWYRFWISEEIEKTVHYFLNGMSYEEISKKVNRTSVAVANMLNRLGYKIRFRWENDEIDYLKKYCDELEVELLSEYLGRSKEAVKVKIRNLYYNKKQD